MTGVFVGILQGVLPQEAPSRDGAETQRLNERIESKFDWEKERSTWAFQPPEPQERPHVARDDWPTQRIDFFTLAAMEANGLEPTLPAEIRTLARRVTYDLTGLPPDPELLKQIDDRPPGETYVATVERALNSNQFGERMASLWLNVARYAEDQAHQVGSNSKNFYPNAFRYRQWVIDAFNRDLPYDSFVRLQLAADLIPDSRRDDAKALGFLGLGPKYYNRGRLDVQADEWEDRVDTVTRTFLGLTVACARCHDHKFDPITIEDYYALAGVFASTKMVNAQFPEDGSDVTEEEKESRIHEIHVVKEGEPRDIPVFKRGQVDNPGPTTPRRFLRVLSSEAPDPYTQGSGRLELAENIAERTNPLTARVYVNRIWSLFFGEPIVDTPSNFGATGSDPTHPELLDDLAVRFMDAGWSTKWLVRELVYSATYRQSASGTPASIEEDPANQWLSRMRRKRLSIEMWRDGVLSISGELEPVGGASLELSDPQNHRRTVYSRISRLSLNPMLMQFDYPDANSHSSRRAHTITPTQKLYALNDQFFLDRADALADRVASEAPTDLEAQIDRAYAFAYFREPSREEAEAALRFLESADPSQRDERLSQFTHALLVSNEMKYLD